MPVSSSPGSSASASSEGFEVRVEPAGVRFTAFAGVPLLQSARAAGVMLPSSCRNGTCRTCICRLLGGQVRHAIEWPGLSADEKAEGFILPCVALPESALVLEQPGAIDLHGVTDDERGSRREDRGLTISRFAPDSPGDDSTRPRGSKPR